MDLGSPPVIEDDTALDQYLRDLRKASRNLRVTTTSPNGNRRGLRGDTIFYNDGSDLKLCRNTSTTAGGGTSWVCEAASSESQLCFEGATADDFETCFSITDPSADRTVTIPNASLDFTATAPALAYSTTGSAGTNTTFVRTDATIAAFDATVPVTQAFGDAAAVGSAAITARRDHKHGMPADPTGKFEQGRLSDARAGSTNSPDISIVLDVSSQVTAILTGLFTTNSSGNCTLSIRQDASIVESSTAGSWQTLHSVNITYSAVVAAGTYAYDVLLDSANCGTYDFQLQVDSKPNT